MTDKAELRYALEERAAIQQYDAGLSKWLAQEAAAKARARRRKKKAPLRELYSATHDILRREVQSAGIPAALNSYPRSYSTSGGD